MGGKLPLPPVDQPCSTWNRECTTDSKLSHQYFNYNKNTNPHLSLCLGDNMFIGAPEVNILVVSALLSSSLSKIYFGHTGV